MSRPMIPNREVRWLGESFVDPNGRVFEWRGEIYRMLTPSASAFWKNLFDQGVVEELVRDRLIVESKIADFTSEAGDLIVHHRRIPIPSYCFEWPPVMLKEAALLTLDLCIRLAGKGLTLQDGHPWNILFDGTQPVFIDMGSIVPAREDVLWAPYQQFCNFFLFPLYLYAANRDRVARWLLRDYLEGVSDRDLLTTLPIWFKLRHPRRTFGVAIPRLLTRVVERLPHHFQHRLLSLPKNVTARLGDSKIRIKFLESIRTKVEKIRLDHSTGQWSGYYATVDENYFSTDLSPGDWRLKQEKVERMVAELKPATVLDIGTNTGRYAMMAASGGARVIACDLDGASVSLCHSEARRQKLDVLSLVTNVFTTARIAGRGGVECPAPTERFRSELVLGLALIHHVVALQRLDISRMVDFFDTLSSRWLLLEFVPPLKPKGGGAPVPLLDDYTAESLQDCLRRRFKSVVRSASYPADRQLFLCEK